MAVAFAEQGAKIAVTDIGVSHAEEGADKAFGQLRDRTGSPVYRRSMSSSWTGPMQRGRGEQEGAAEIATPPS